MTKFLLVLIILLGTVQNASSASPFEMQFEYFKLIKTLKANFTQTKLIKSMNLKIESSGNLEVDRPDNFTWEVIKPGSIKFIYSKDRMQLIKNNEKSLDMDTKNVGSNALKMIDFLRSWMVMDKGFILKNFTIVENSKNQFTFYPIGDFKLFQHVSIKLGKKAEILEMNMTELSSDVINLNFSNHKIIYAN